jgi:protein-S-isoprenylcysteine O-methyltransferase Ste14
LAAHRGYVLRRSPELLKRRRRIGEGTKRWDLAWNLAFWPLLASIAISGAIQFRAVGPGFPTPTLALGVGLFSVAMALSAWAMASNPHFEGTVRIQTEIEHRVVSTGPYRLVRHPGYVGLALWALAIPLLVLSTWALLPAAATVAWVVLRTALEDRTLQRKLAGYAEYAQRVRYRLCPGLW